MIWLLRHAEAEDGSPDAERPLTRQGEAQSRDTGAALASMGVSFDACASSPKLRAADTARIVCEQLDGLEVQLDERLGGGPFDPRALAAELGEEVLLVGHDPDFSLAVHRMTGAQVRMQKCGLAAVAKGELILLLRPSELSAIAAAVPARSE
ncbi:MAG TPA: phosphoglycerate mutase family protein [Thermoleophilaceae bacterium]|nr:phosphoglycerate mutase family protein [Thermoleophilaceae bacterium]